MIRHNVEQKAPATTRKGQPFEPYVPARLSPTLVNVARDLRAQYELFCYRLIIPFDHLQENVPDFFLLVRALPLKKYQSVKDPLSHSRGGCGNYHNTRMLEDRRQNGVFGYLPCNNLKSH